MYETSRGGNIRKGRRVTAAAATMMITMRMMSLTNRVEEDVEQTDMKNKCKCKDKNNKKVNKEEEIRV